MEISSLLGIWLREWFSTHLAQWSLDETMTPSRVKASMPDMRRLSPDEHVQMIMVCLGASVVKHLDDVWAMAFRCCASNLNEATRLSTSEEHG